MEYSEEDDEQKVIDPEEAKKLEKQIFAEENSLPTSDQPFVDDHAVYIDYNPQAALKIITNLQECTIYERQTYTKHLAEIVDKIGVEAIPHLPQIFEILVKQSNEILRDFLLQIEPLIIFFQKQENGIEQIRDMLINPLLALNKSSDLHIKQNSGKELANIALLLNEKDRQRYILKNVLQNAKDDTNEDNRIVAIQQLSKIAPCFNNSNVCEQFVGLEILSLGDDPQLRVRKESIRNLVSVGKVVSQQFFVNKLFPFYKKKCSDTNWGIRKDCAEIIVDIFSLSDKQGKKDLQQILLKFVKDANKWVKISSYQKLGEFVYAQREEELSEEVLQSYLNMTSDSVKNLTMDVTMLVNCAYNFPAILLVYGKQQWPKLHQTLQKLISFKNKKIKRPLAYSLHEIAKIVGKDIAWRDLVTIWNEFLEDNSDQVKYGAVQIMADFLAVFDQDQREKMIDAFQVLQESKKKWRIRELIATQIQKLIKIYTSEAIYQYIVPIALKLCQDSVAQVRKEATQQVTYLLQNLNGVEENNLLDILIDQIIGFSHSHRSHQRQAFVQMNHNIINDTPEIFEEKFLPALEKLSKDKVISVRIQLARLIAEHIENNGKFVNNETFIKIKEQLTNDISTDVKIILKKQDQYQFLEYNPKKFQFKKQNLEESSTNNNEQLQQVNQEQMQQKQNDDSVKSELQQQQQESQTQNENYAIQQNDESHNHSETTDSSSQNQDQIENVSQKMELEEQYKMEVENSSEQQEN